MEDPARSEWWRYIPTNNEHKAKRFNICKKKVWYCKPELISTVFIRQNNTYQQTL